MERSAVVTCAVLVLFTAVAAGLAYREGELALQVRAENVAVELAEGIREVVERDVAVATILATQIEEPASISSPEWSARVGRAWRAGGFQQISAVNLAIRATSPDQLAALLELRPEGEHSPFALRVAAEPPHSVVVQVWPERSNAEALGFDIATNPTAHAVQERAVRSNRPLATPPIELVQEREGQRATVIYVPVVTPVDGRVRGALTLVFRAEEVLRQVRPLGTDDVAVRWEDAAVTGDGWLAGSARRFDEPRGSAEIAGFGPAWTITADTSRSQLAPVTLLAPWGIGIGGLAVAVSVFLTMSSGSRLRRRAEQLAEARGEELRRQAHELQVANEELRDLDAVKDRVLRSVTHDLRGPLTVIVGMTDLLGRSELDGPRREQLLSRVQHQAARLDRMVDELATASQLDAGRLVARPTDLDLGQLVARVVQDLGDADVRATTPAVPARADAAHVERVLVNLLSNAQRHGAPPIDVTVTPTSTDVVEMQVRDHGPGVDPAERQRIFKEFTSLDDASRGDGLGLGLAISRRLAELNGGSLTCEPPDEGPGARFVLRLPAGDADRRVAPPRLPEADVAG